MSDIEIDDGKYDFVVRLISREIGEVIIENEHIHLFEMIEDIFSVCMTAKIQFVDKLGATEIFPITGNEFISITYGSENTTKIFMIYDFKNIYQSNDSFSTLNQTIEMYLVEPFHIDLTQMKYSVSWKNEKISNIVKDISTNFLYIDEFEIFEDTNEKLPYFYMPYWNSLEALKWLLPRSSGNKSKMAGYLFYSNTKGINYHTLEEIFQSKRYEKKSTGERVQYQFSNLDNIGDPYRILTWNIKPINYQSLLYLRGGHKLGYDFNEKELLNLEFDYDKVLSKYTLMGKRTIFPSDISKENTSYILEGDNDINILKNIAYHEFITRYTKQFAVHLYVNGLDSRYAGMLIDIPWKSSIQGEISNSLYEGDFLVKSITHQFSLNNVPTYRQLMVAVKTGYFNPESRILHKAKKHMKTRA